MDKGQQDIHRCRELIADGICRDRVRNVEKERLVFFAFYEIECAPGVAFGQFISIHRPEDESVPWVVVHAEPLGAATGHQAGTGRSADPSSHTKVGKLTVLLRHPVEMRRSVES